MGTGEGSSNGLKKLKTPHWERWGVKRGDGKEKEKGHPLQWMSGFD